MKKFGLALLMIVASAVMLTGCGGNNTSAEPDWAITIDGLEAEAEFTNLDAEEVGSKELTTVKETDDGEIEQAWTGVLLKDVLAYLGAGDFTKVIVEASDGYSQEYEPEAVNSDGTILAITVNGEELGEDGPVQLVAKDLSGMFWIKNVARIEIVE